MQKISLRKPVLKNRTAPEIEAALGPFMPEGIAQNPILMQSDGIHPRAEAQGKIVDNVWQPLINLLRLPSSVQ